MTNQIKRDKAISNCLKTVRDTFEILSNQLSVESLKACGYYEAKDNLDNQLVIIDSLLVEDEIEIERVKRLSEPVIEELSISEEPTPSEEDNLI